MHTLDKRKSHYGKTCEWRDPVQVTGGGNCSVAAARHAMGIDWMVKRELNEAIPPAYTEYIGLQLMSIVAGGDWTAEPSPECTALPVSQLPLPLR